MKVILEDAYQARDVRVYKNYSPAIRAEREGLKVMEYDSDNTQGWRQG